MFLRAYLPLDGTWQQHLLYFWSNHLRLQEGVCPELFQKVAEAMIECVPSEKKYFDNDSVLVELNLINQSVLRYLSNLISLKEYMKVTLTKTMDFEW